MDGTSLHGSSPPRRQRWSAMHRKTKSEAMWSGPRTQTSGEETNKPGGGEDSNSLRTDRSSAVSCETMSSTSADKGLLQDFDLPNFEHPCASSPDGKTPRTSRRSRKTSKSQQGGPDHCSPTKLQSSTSSSSNSNSSGSRRGGPPCSVEIATAGTSILQPKVSRDSSNRNNDSSIDTIDLEDLYQEAIRADFERKKPENQVVSNHNKDVDQNGNNTKRDKKGQRPSPYVPPAPKTYNPMMEESFVLRDDEDNEEIPAHLAQLEQEREMIELAMQRSMQDSQSLAAKETTGSPQRSRRRSKRPESTTSCISGNNRSDHAPESWDASWREGETEEERLERLNQEMLDLALQQSRSDCLGPFPH